MTFPQLESYNVFVRLNQTTQMAPPSSAQAPYTFKLYQIPFSHYCERARWALDFAGITYSVASYLPLFHVLPLVAARGPKRDAKVDTPASTPLLAAYAAGTSSAGFFKDDSSAIVRYCNDQLPAESSLYPSEYADQIAEVEKLSHDSLGKAVRLACYGYLLNEPNLMQEVGRRNVASCLQKVVWVLFNGLVRFLLRRALKVFPPACARAEERLRVIFADVSDRLLRNAKAQGVPVEQAYLCGDGFTAADLTFSALAAPILCVTQEEGYGAWIPPLFYYPANSCAGLHKLVAELRATPAGQHVGRMYAQHRRRTSGGGGGGGTG